MRKLVTNFPIKPFLRKLESYLVDRLTHFQIDVRGREDFTRQPLGSAPCPPQPPDQTHPRPGQPRRAWQTETALIPAHLQYWPQLISNVSQILHSYT